MPDETPEAEPPHEGTGPLTSEGGMGFELPGIKFKLWGRARFVTTALLVFAGIAAWFFLIDRGDGLLKATLSMLLFEFLAFLGYKFMRFRVKS